MKIQVVTLSLGSLALLAPLAARADDPIQSIVPVPYAPILGVRALPLQKFSPKDGMVQKPPRNSVPLLVPTVPAPKTDDAIVIGPKKKAPLSIFPSYGQTAPRLYLVPPKGGTSAPAPKTYYFTLPPTSTAPNLGATSPFFLAPPATPNSLYQPFVLPPSAANGAKSGR